MSNFSNSGGWQPGAADTTPKSETAKVKVNATILWADLKTPNELAGKYQVVLSEISEAGRTKLENELGIEVRNDSIKYPDRGNFITVKSVNPIKVWGTDGEEIFENIGNGSKAQATLTAYEWKFQNKTGRSPSLSRLTVTDLVVFELGDSNADDSELAAF